MVRVEVTICDYCAEAMMMFWGMSLFGLSGVGKRVDAQMSIVALMDDDGLCAQGAPHELGDANCWFVVVPMPDVIYAESKHAKATKVKDANCFVNMYSLAVINATQNEINGTLQKVPISLMSIQYSRLTSPSAPHSLSTACH